MSRTGYHSPAGPWKAEADYRRGAAVDHLRLEQAGHPGVRSDPDPEVPDPGATGQALHARRGDEEANLR